MPFKTVQAMTFPFLIFDADTKPLSWKHGALLMEGEVMCWHFESVLPKDPS